MSSKTAFILTVVNALLLIGNLIKLVKSLEHYTPIKIVLDDRFYAFVFEKNNGLLSSTIVYYLDEFNLLAQ